MTRSAPGHQDRCAGSALGLHRVLEPAGVLPQAAWRLDPAPVIGPDEVRIQVDRLNLDAASYRQLRESSGGSAEAMRAAVLAIVAGRGKMQNPVTGSGGMLTGVVEEAGPQSPLGLAAGDRIATLVSLSLTPLAISDGLAGWDGTSEPVPCGGRPTLVRALDRHGPSRCPARPAGPRRAGCVRPPGAHLPGRGRGSPPRGRRRWPGPPQRGRAGRGDPRGGRQERLA